jgi:molecular chaperone GrpE (heat shock protein)
LYVEYLSKEISNFTDDLSKTQIKKWQTFKDNLLHGVEYYEDMFSKTSFFRPNLEKINAQLKEFQAKIKAIEIPQLG